LIDKKIPLSEKADKKVLLSKGQVIWVVGERIDDRFKITSKTRRVLRMTCSKRQAD
jgi:tRNA(Ile)-lysidine synthase